MPDGFKTDVDKDGWRHQVEKGPPDHRGVLGAGRVPDQGEIEVIDSNQRQTDTGVLILLKTSKLMAEYAARRLRL
jgi:hypothetical protein